MKIICAPSDFDFRSVAADVEVVLFGHSDRPKTRGSVGAAAKDEIVRRKLRPAPRAWDLLAIAFSVIAADLAGHRNRSPDGWTRDYELTVAVADRKFWNSQASALEQLLGFLTTDRWSLRFVDQGILPAPDANPVKPTEDSVVLLSGGLDSFAGVLDLVANGRRPFAVSQLVRGDAEVQTSLARIIGGGLTHLQLNHNAIVPDPEEPPSQRSRSVVFFAYGILAATALANYQAGQEVPLYVCENGFIAINPPLTDLRIGSLSTRTCHPVVVALLQQVLDAAGLRVRITNPHQFATKGELLAKCADQTRLKAHAHETTSCGRYKRFGYQHCGRCLPCLIRRAAFLGWGVRDRTKYVYRDLSIRDAEHAGSDDVRAAAMAVLKVREDGLDRWLGATLSSRLLSRVPELKDVAARGLSELGRFIERAKVR